MRLALQWLRENPTETATTAARCHSLANEHGVQQAWRREKKKNERRKKSAAGGHNRIFGPDQHQALIQYAADHQCGIEGIGHGADAQIAQIILVPAKPRRHADGD